MKSHCQQSSPWVWPTDQPNNAIPEDIKHTRFLTGNIRLDGLNQAGWVEGGDYGSRDCFQKQVLANTSQTGVLVNLFGPGSHLNWQFIDENIIFRSAKWTLLMQSSMPRVRPLIVRLLPIPFHRTATPCHLLRCHFNWIYNKVFEKMNSRLMRGGFRQIV